MAHGTARPPVPKITAKDIAGAAAGAARLLGSLCGKGGAK